jgi:hypothetical protein
LTGLVPSKIGVLDPATQLSKDMFDGLDLLEYRRAVTPEDFEAIGRLRQRAFDARDIYERKFGESVIEDLDYDPDSFVFGVYFQHELVSTIRVSLLTSETRNTPATYIFGDVLNPLLDQGMTFIDPSRLAIETVFTKLIPGLPILTLRLPIIATAYFNADYCLSAVKKEHRGFYLRIFRSTLLAGPYNPPGMNVDAVLLGGSVQQREDLFSRYPVFSFKDSEARMLFGDYEREQVPFCVRPTARFAVRAA